MFEIWITEDMRLALYQLADTQVFVSTNIT